MRRIRSLRGTAIIALTMLSLAGGTAGAQAPRQIKLKPADAKLDVEFVGPNGARELSDGRVILTDVRQNAFLVADFKTGKTTPIGRQGRGPLEWILAVRVLRLKGDSSLHADPNSRRWNLLDGPRIVATLPPDAPVLVVTNGAARGADAQGHVMTIGRSIPRPEGETKRDERDSLPVILVSRATARADTIAMLRDAPSTTVIERNAAGKVTSVSGGRPAFSTAEDALLFIDGWLAIARLNPYRVDWRSPDGGVVKGRALPVPVVSLDAREKQAYLDRNAKFIEEVKKYPEAERRATVMRRFTDLPATIPPFAASGAIADSRGAPHGLVAGPAGELLIQRNVTAAFALPRYDIVDRRGAYVGQITLAKGERILSFGKKSVYVAWTDEDDVERVRRHPWP